MIVFLTHKKKIFFTSQELSHRFLNIDHRGNKEFKKSGREKTSREIKIVLPDGF